MFAFIKGVATILSDTSIIVFTHGIGYEINIHKRMKIENESDVSLFLHFAHKEDSMSLYGFENREEKTMFTTLLKAQGVGTKLAMETLSTYSVADIMDILFTKDINRLKTISGMGAKKAEKLLFELRDKIEKIDIKNIEPNSYNSNESDALKALMSLGFSNIEAANAITKIEDKNKLTVESLISESLRHLSKI